MKRILVCEDEAAIREFVVINPPKAGYAVREAETGEAARGYSWRKMENSRLLCLT